MIARSPFEENSDRQFRLVRIPHGQHSTSSSPLQVNIIRVMPISNGSLHASKQAKSKIDDYDVMPPRTTSEILRKYIPISAQNYIEIFADGQLG
jgi:hypothetical protein